MSALAHMSHFLLMKLFQNLSLVAQSEGSLVFCQMGLVLRNRQRGEPLLLLAQTGELGN